MISKSDLIILVVSATALGAGLYRWQRDIGAPLVATASPPPVERAVGEGADVTGKLVRGADGERAANGTIVVRRVPGADPSSAADPAIGAPVREDAAAATRSPSVAPSPDGAATTLPASTRSSDETALYGRYVIREGDYLGKLANRFGTSVATLQSINDLDGTTIHVGEELRYPLPAN